MKLKSALLASLLFLVACSNGKDGAKNEATNTEEFQTITKVPIRLPEVGTSSVKVSQKTSVSVFKLSQEESTQIRALPKLIALPLRVTGATGNSLSPLALQASCEDRILVETRFAIDAALLGKEIQPSLTLPAEAICESQIEVVLVHTLSTSFEQGQILVTDLTSKN